MHTNHDATSKPLKLIGSNRLTRRAPGARLLGFALVGTIAFASACAGDLGGLYEEQSPDAAEGPLSDAGTADSADGATLDSADAGRPDTTDAGTTASADGATPESADTGRPDTTDAGTTASADGATPESADTGGSDDAGTPDSVDAGTPPAADAGTPPDPCTPTTCAKQGKNCGTIPNGCEGTLDCGICASGTCGGGGVPNVCGPPPPNPSYSCTKTLSPGGDVQAFVDSLSSGQTGCLRGGAYSAANLYFRRAGTTIASFPGERAAITVGYSEISPGQANVTLKRLDLSTSDLHTIRVFGDNAVLELNSFTNARAEGAGACIGVGGSSGKPNGVIIRGNKFFDCGGTGTNLNHGIYANSYTNLTIVDNLFWNSGAYSIQLYPDANGTIVRHNVIDGSNEYSVRGGLVIDGTSNDHLIECNIFAYTNSAAIIVRTGTGHQANRNCFWSNRGGNIEGSIPESSNVSADPRFVSRSAHDYRLDSGSGCLPTVEYDTAAKVDAAW